MQDESTGTGSSLPIAPGMELRSSSIKVCLAQIVCVRIPSKYSFRRELSGFWGRLLAIQQQHCGGRSGQRPVRGLEHDGESYSEHATFRQYSSTEGRWMSPDPYDVSYDPSNPQSLNRYSYVLNNPFTLKDPLGLDSLVCSTQTFSTSSGGGGHEGDDDGDQTAQKTDAITIRPRAFDSGSDTTCVLLQDGPGLTGTIDPVEAPDLPVTNTPGQQMPPSNAAARCAAQTQAAAAAQPPITPSAQNIIDGIGGAAIGIGLAPEDAPFLPTLYKATTGFFAGLFRRGLVHIAQQGLMFNAAFQGCLADAGEPMSPTVIQ